MKTSTQGREYFVNVPEDFIEDDFNLTGLAAIVPYYSEALDMILDVELEADKAQQMPDIEASAELLYSLIHQRFLLTRQGLQRMVQMLFINNLTLVYQVF